MCFCSRFLNEFLEHEFLILSGTFDQVLTPVVLIQRSAYLIIKHTKKSERCFLLLIFNEFLNKRLFSIFVDTIIQNLWTHLSYKMSLDIMLHVFFLL